MKTTVIISLALACLLSSSRAQKLQFTFDTAGDQIARTWICTTCPASRADVKPNTLTSGHRDTVRRIMGYGVRGVGFGMRFASFGVRNAGFEFLRKGDLDDGRWRNEVQGRVMGCCGIGMRPRKIWFIF